ncbi:hypothetical protein [Streptococcus oricebi]|uniref:Uncharacterized protein n=1 Tax=Streptococcus oricebi TaxID=1547447 RepID=A0ABS5B4K9_9STRE|nr:hypothetical protein [Streptococcus oricebi]MBP2623690.1 hypothetical protein [Streptococcus oricebi]
MKKIIHKKFNKWNIGCLVCLLVLVFFIAFFIIGSLNYGRYSLKPGESVKIEVNSLTNQPDFSSELTLDNLSGAKLELTGDDSPTWAELKGENNSENVYYNIETQTIHTRRKNEEGNWERVELENSPKQDVYLKESEFNHSSKRRKGSWSNRL